MTKSILYVEGLTKVYGAKRALDGVTFGLESGRIYGLVGNNGAGKSTLLRLITGLSRPTSGSIRLFDSHNERELRRARQRTGALVERPAYYRDMRVSQNLRAQAMLCRRQPKAAEIEALRERVGIGRNQIGDPRLSQCSLGQQQRYGIAAALLGEPELLILDEPINGLDPSGVQEVREYLREVQAQGITILISSHLLEELYKLATDYIFLDQGRIIEQITAKVLDERLAENQEDGLETYFLDLVKRHREGAPS